jgi:serine/threonine protein phosphatase 1
MAKTYVIGDIHGALKALKQIIVRLNPQQDDKLIFLGDYVDGWSESYGAGQRIFLCFYQGQS